VRLALGIVAGIAIGLSLSPANAAPAKTVLAKTTPSKTAPAKTASAKPAPPKVAPPKAGVLGQIIRISTPGSVLITHQGSPQAPAKAYEPLYNGDMVTAQVGQAILAIVGSAAGVTVTPQNSPFQVKGVAGSVDAGLLQRVVAEWAWIFQPPLNSPVPLEARSLTPQPVQNFTPLVAQKVRSGEAQSLPVVWDGPIADVTLAAAAAPACPKASPTTDNEPPEPPPMEDRPRFALVDCPALAPGAYHLVVGEVQPLTVDLVVAPEAAPQGSADEQAIAAMDVLKNQADHRLQALADLQRLSLHSYFALAVMNKVRTSP
jgi:hypothetical protein